MARDMLCDPGYVCGLRAPSCKESVSGRARRPSPTQRTCSSPLFLRRSCHTLRRRFLLNIEISQIPLMSTADGTEPSSNRHRLLRGASSPTTLPRGGRDPVISHWLKTDSATRPGWSLTPAMLRGVSGSLGICVAHDARDIAHRGTTRSAVPRPL